MTVPSATERHRGPSAEIRGALPTHLGGGATIALLALLAGCAFDGPDPDGTLYRCGANGLCPDGFDCVNGVCIAQDDDQPDAAPGGMIDGRINGGTIDSSAIDSNPGPADAAEPQTLTFGERADSDVQGVTADTSLDSTAQFDPRGASTELYLDSSPPQVVLIRFELIAIPVGSIVESAELEVVVFDPQVNGDARAQVMILDWSEATATYALARSGEPWPNSGAGGASAHPEVVASFAPVVDGVYTVPLPAEVVQAWVDDPSSNAGLRWTSTSPDGNNLRMVSREGAPAERPVLRVTFR